MKKIIILFIILLLSITGFTQKDGENIVIGKYKKLYSKILKEDRLLLVKLPKNYDSNIEKHPVLYLLYGDYMEQYFADAVSTIHKLSESGKIPKMILIGVGNTERYRDLLPIDRRGSIENADKFQSFFSKELIPFINKSYRTNNYRILVGPQAGGSFGLNTIIKKNEMFNAFLINSPFFSNPSNDFLIKIAPDILKRPEILKKFFYITYKLTNVPRFKIEFMKKFRKILNDEILKDSNWVFNELKNNNSFIPPLGIKNGLRLLFDEYRFPMNRPVKGINDLKLYYKKVSDKYGFIIKIPARVILIKGDHFNSKKDTKKALEFYNFLLKQYPKDLNGYFRLADISERNGDYKGALKNFKILEKLSPGEVFFKKSVIRLEKKIKGK